MTPSMSRLWGASVPRRALLAAAAAAIGMVPGQRMAMARRQNAYEAIEAMLPSEADLGRTQRLYRLDDLPYLAHSTFSIGENFSRRPWGWVAAVSRWFVAGRANPEDANVIKVSIHQFDAMPERDEILRSFIEDRVHLDDYRLVEPADGYPNRPRLVKLGGGSAWTLMLDCTDSLVVEVEGVGQVDPTFDVGGILRRCMDRIAYGVFEQPPAPSDPLAGERLFGWADDRTWRGDDWIVCCRWWMGQTFDLATPSPMVLSLRVVNRGPDPAPYPASQFLVIESSGDRVPPLAGESLFVELATDAQGTVSTDLMEPFRVYEIGLRYLAIPSGDRINVEWASEGIQFDPYMINR